MSRQKVIQFKKIEEEKQIIEMKSLHQEQKGQLDIEYKQELDTFNEDWDKRFFDLNEEYEKKQQILLEEHQKEIDEIVNEFEEKYLKQPKPPTELLNVQKMLEQAVKQKEYFHL